MGRRPRGNNPDGRSWPLQPVLVVPDLESDVNDMATDAFHRVERPKVVSPAFLPRVLEWFPQVRALSLDCFDTLLWRHTERPEDVFHLLARGRLYRASGISAADRIAAEATARKLAIVRGEAGEVGLEAIYRAHRRDLTDARLAELVDEELATEMRSCYAHPGALSLLRNARKRGLAVTIVSDTYLSEPLLRRLLAHALPADALGAIGRVVCSSDHGRSKTQGLLEIAHTGEAVPRSSILHVGDNEHADYRAALRAGLQAVHLVQRTDRQERQAAMRATALSILLPEVRHARALHDPYRGVASLQAGAEANAVAQLGRMSIGPVMHAFANWIERERRDLADRHGSARLFFLLRDGHLPHTVHRELFPDAAAHAVRISRYTAYAASFRSLEDIDRYLAQFVETRRFEAIARQLQLDPETAARLVESALGAGDPVSAFVEAVRRPDVVEAIVAASARFRARMQGYLQRCTGMKPGETVVFVDLGYAGTAQRVLAPVFEEEWGVRLQGRYLLSTGASDDTRRGFIDRSWCDERALGALVPFVAVMENLCCAPGGSVAGYTGEGDAVLAREGLDGEQTALVEQAQAACLAFARQAQAFHSSLGGAVEMEWLREAALAEFARVVYFPDRTELEALSRFGLEVNMGTDDHLRLFDREAGLDGLRRRGVNFIERHSGMRLQYPAELRSASLELSMALLVQHRYSLAIPLDEWTQRQEEIPVLVLRGQASATETIRARATHDGYFSALLPMGRGDLHLGLLLGQSYAWIQVLGVEAIAQRYLAGATESLHSRDLANDIVLDGMRDHGGGLLECEGTASLIMIPAGLAGFAEPATCRFVFRPIVRRIASVARPHEAAEPCVERPQRMPQGAA